MIPISARVSAEGVFKRLNDFPATLDKYLIPAIDRWALETEREAQRAASKFDSFGTNKLAIHREALIKSTHALKQFPTTHQTSCRDG